MTIKSVKYQIGNIMIACEYAKQETNFQKKKKNLLFFFTKISWEVTHVGCWFPILGPKWVGWSPMWGAQPYCYRAPPLPLFIKGGELPWAIFK